MKLLDTNVLVRFITRDVPHLAKQADAWIAEASPGELSVGDAVLDELTFVLAFNKTYQLPRGVIARALQHIVRLPSIQITTDAQMAIEYFERYPRLDFVDCLLLAQAARGRTSIYTFDKDLAKATGA